MYVMRKKKRGLQFVTLVKMREEIISFMSIE